MKSVYISNIQKFCVHDGPGIRTVVFLMGCPLRCKWCQNPENFYGKPVLMYNRSLCTGCGQCLRHCPRNVGVLPGIMVIDRVKCTGCGVCTEHCYTNAKTICGKKMTADEIFREVMKDAVFYRESGGGVTLSGGEAAINSGFCAELFKKLHREGIHTAIETSGYCSPEDLLKFDHYTDLFLFDLKAITGALHASWTGVDNTRIKSNLVILLNKGRRVIIRIPLIPGVNDGTEFERMMKYLVSLEKIKEVHILPFHQLGSSKYRQAGTDYKMEQVEECSAEQAEQYAEICRSYGFVVNIGGWDCR